MAQAGKRRAHSNHAQGFKARKHDHVESHVEQIDDAASQYQHSIHRYVSVFEVSLLFLGV